jgi:hypothetical protein
VSAGAFESFEVLRAVGSDISYAAFGSLNANSPAPGPGPWEYVDSTAVVGQTYHYKVRGRSAARIQTTGPVRVVARVTANPTPPPEVPPATVVLYPSRPNPATDRAIVEFNLPTRLTTELQIYDLRGRLVWQESRRHWPAGLQRVIWDTMNGQGHPVASGEYVMQLKWSSGVRVQRITIVR